MSALPLAELYDLLRANGFVIGVDDHVRIGRLLAQDAAWTPELLRTAVAALVVTSSDEQGLFDACWRRWMPPSAPVVDPDIRWRSKPRLLGTAPLPGATRAPTRRRAVAASSAVALGMLGALFVLVSRAPHGDGAPEGEPVVDAVAGDLGGTPHPSEARGASSEAASASSASKLDGGAPGWAGGGATADRTLAPRPALTSLAYTAMDPVQVVLVVSVLVLVAVAVAFARRVRARRRFVPGPWRYELAVPPANGLVLPSEDVEDAAVDLAWRAPGLTDDIDIERSIAATVTEGGRPTFVRQRVLHPLRYLVLEDVAGIAANWRFLYDELFQGLAREGLELERCTFRGSPQWCTDATGAELPLSELLDSADALIVVSDGKTAVDPVRGDRAPWVGQLPRLPRRLWINPFPVPRWSTGAHEIAAETPMEHGAIGALVALRPGAQSSIRDPGMYAPVLERGPGTETALVALRASLSPRAFALVAAVAIVGGPKVTLARWLAESYCLKLDEKEWLYIVTLPWFGGGQWPQGLAERLGAALETEDPCFARSLRSLAQRLLAASEPPRGSAAHLQWELDGARQAFLRGERRAAARMLDRILLTPFARQAGSALASFGLSNRRRTAMAFSFALTLLAVIGALGARAGFFDRPQPVVVMNERTAERHLVKISGDNATLPRPMGEPWPEPFSVMVVDGNGNAVAGAHAVWSNPQLGPRFYISDSDAKGIARAAQLYKSPMRDQVAQVAQLVSEWSGERFVDTPPVADGDRVVFRFSQVPMRFKLKVTVTVTPDEAARIAQVFLDGKLIGESTELETHPGGTFGLRVVAPGYGAVEKILDVGGDDNDDDVPTDSMSVEVKLDRDPPGKKRNAKSGGLIDI